MIGRKRGAPTPLMRRDKIPALPEKLSKTTKATRLGFYNKISNVRSSSSRTIMSPEWPCHMAIAGSNNSQPYDIAAFQSAPYTHSAARREVITPLIS